MVHRTAPFVVVFVLCLVLLTQSASAAGESWFKAIQDGDRLEQQSKHVEAEALWGNLKIGPNWKDEITVDRCHCYDPVARINDPNRSP